MKEIDYSALIPLFQKGNQKDFYSPLYEAPFTIEDKCYATDGHAMIMFDKKHFPFAKPLYEGRNPEDILSVIPVKQAYPVKTVTLRELRKSIKDVEQIRVSSECAACQGIGEVAYSFDHNDEHFTENFKCPICNGSGLSGKEDGFELSKAVCVKIGICHFMPRMIEKLIKVLEILDAVSIDIMAQERAHEANIFTVSEIDMLIMPALAEPESDTKCIYTFK